MWTTQHTLKFHGSNDTLRFRDGLVCFDQRIWIFGGEFNHDFDVIEICLDLRAFFEHCLKLGSLSQEFLSGHLVIPKLGLSAQVVEFGDALCFVSDVKDTP